MQPDGLIQPGAISERDMAELNIYKAQGFGYRRGRAQSPALLLVDFTMALTTRSSLAAAILQPPSSAAKDCCSCSARGWPVAHSRMVYAADGSDAGVFARKVPGLAALSEDDPAGQIVPQLRPRAGELVVRKTETSAFFGSGRTRWLIQRRVDTLAVAGCTTSGCVHVSEVDPASRKSMRMS
jgi:maleamate amidohydrolase